MIYQNQKDIATRQNHYHEITKFFSKMRTPPETDYDQGIETYSQEKEQHVQSKYKYQVNEIAELHRRATDFL
jgi:hypothetical protein